MHQHSRHMAGTAPATHGHTIRWAQHYDFFVRLLTFGKESSFRAETIHRAALQPGETVRIEKRHSFKPITTRKYYSGAHAIALKINGQEFEGLPFHLEI